MRVLVSRGFWSAAFAVTMVSPAVLHATTKSHATTVAGQAQGGVGPFGCATSGPQQDVRTFFNAAVGIPTEGQAACNLSGTVENQSGAGATSVASTATRAFNNGTADISASAHANYDGVGTQATGTYGGYSTTGSYAAGEGAAFVQDLLTFGGGIGAGFVTFGFTIDGSMHAYGNSEALTQLNYRVANGPIYSVFSARLGRGTGDIRAFDTPDFTGFTNTGTEIAGSGVAYTFAIPFTFGTPIDFTYALFSVAYPGSLGGSAESAFASTARLSAISVRDNAGNIVDFTATSGSGTLYDALGAHLPNVGAVPEPATWAMMTIGFGMIGGAIRRRRAQGIRAAA